LLITLRWNEAGVEGKREHFVFEAFVIKLHDNVSRDWHTVTSKSQGVFAFR